MFVIFCVGYGGALAVLLNADVHYLLELLGVTAVVAGFVLAVREHVLHLGAGIASAQLRSDGSWSLQCGDGVRAQAHLEGESVVLSWITILNFRTTDGRRRSLLLLPDNIDGNAFRRLRVRLRLGA